uniref:Secreted protein n=1 Tax=Heterorhabditis bacteriophora TaxID=37862 RepID=A0A1I7WI48_HETBA
MSILTPGNVYRRGLVVVTGVYIVLADYLLCVCDIPAEVRSRLRWGFRPFAQQTAVDRASHNLRCSWMVSLEVSEESKLIGGFFSLFFRALLSRGICLSAAKSRGFASALLSHLLLGRRVGQFWTLQERSALKI